jgi:hypothetical protein
LVLDENGNKIGSNYRWLDNGKDKFIVGNEEIRKICYDKIARYYRKNYLTVDETYKQMNDEIGDENVDKRCFSNQKTEEIVNETGTNSTDDISDSDIVDIQTS